MNILIAINRKFVFPAKALIRSIAENNSENIDVFIVHNKLKKSDFKSFERLAASYKDNRVKISFIYIDDSAVSTFTKEWELKWPPEIFFRIAALYQLPESVDRILYLDSDTMVNGSLKDLYNTDLQNYTIAAVKDAGLLWTPHKIEARKKTMGIDKDVTYANSGVMLIDVKKFVSAYTFDEILSSVIEYSEKLYYPDQDLINLLFQHQIYVFPDLRYNLYSPAHCWNPLMFAEGYEDEVVVFHFFASNKPWKWRNVNRMRWTFWKYAVMNGDYPRFAWFLFKTATIGTVRNIFHLIAVGHGYRFFYGSGKGD